jgi:hypothetical protein
MPPGRIKVSQHTHAANTETLIQLKTTPFCEQKKWIYGKRRNQRFCLTEKKKKKKIKTNSSCKNTQVLAEVCKSCVLSLRALRPVVVLLLGILLEVARVSVRPNLGLNGWLQSTANNVLPVNSLEPSMLLFLIQWYKNTIRLYFSSNVHIQKYLITTNETNLDCFGTSLGATESLVGIRDQKLSNEILGFWTEVIWPLNVALKDLLVYSEGFVIVEWGKAAQFCLFV